VLDNQSKLAITDLSGNKERKMIGNESFMPKEPAFDERHVDSDQFIEIVF